MLRSIICSLGLCAAIASAAPAWAQETISIPVSYADLNLANSAGLAVFQRRIENAVTDICGPDEKNRDVQAEVSRCKAAVRERVTPQVNAALSEAHRTQLASNTADHLSEPTSR